MIKRLKTKNKYDVFLFIIVASLSGGDIGGYLQLSRVVGMLLLIPLLQIISKCKYVKTQSYVFVIFISYCILSLLWTRNSVSGIKEIIYYIVHLILYVELICFSQKALNPQRSIAMGWCIAALICCIIGIREILYGVHLSIASENNYYFNTGQNIIVRQVAFATYGNYNAFVTFLCFSFPWIFYLYQDKNRSGSYFRYLSLLTIVLLTLIVFTDGSRGGFLSLILMFAIYIVKIKKTTKAIFSLCLLGSILGWLIYKYNDSIFVVLIARSSNMGLTEDSSRIEIWSNALKLLFETGGFGVGVGSLMTRMNEVSSGGISITHNVFMEFLVQFGIVFSIILGGFILKILRNTCKMSNNVNKVPVLMALMAMPIYGVINSGYLLAPGFFILMGTIYVFVYGKKINKNTLISYAY